MKRILPAQDLPSHAMKFQNELGGEAALSRLRIRLADRGMKLMLDFVPNHTGLDHWWVKDHIDFYMPGSEQDIESEPANFTSISLESG